MLFGKTDLRNEDEVSVYTENTQAGDLHMTAIETVFDYDFIAKL